MHGNLICWSLLCLINLHIPDSPWLFVSWIQTPLAISFLYALQAASPIREWPWHFENRATQCKPPRPKTRVQGTVSEGDPHLTGEQLDVQFWKQTTGVTIRLSPKIVNSLNKNELLHNSKPLSPSEKIMLKGLFGNSGRLHIMDLIYDLRQVSRYTNWLTYKGKETCNILKSKRN